MRNRKPTSYRAFLITIPFLLGACSGKQTGTDEVFNPNDVKSGDCDNPFIGADDLATNIGFANLACIKKIVQDFKVDLNKPMMGPFNNEGNLPLVEALQSNALFFAKDKPTATISLLLSLGSEVNARTRAGKTVLEIALEVDSPDAKHFVINASGLDVNQAGSKMYALEQTIANKDEDSAKLLLAKNAKIELHKRSTPNLHAAVGNKLEATVRDLMKRGALLNEESNGTRALNIAIATGQEPLALAIAEAGAEINYTTGQKMTPLHQAIGAQMKKLAQHLIGIGASLDAPDGSQNSPLHLAIRGMKNDSDVADALIAAGASLQVRDANQKTALFAAVEEGRRDLTAKLIQRGAAVDTLDVSGRSLLEAAADQEIVDALVKNGAPIDVKSSRGETPISAHTAAGRVDAVRLLKNKGANLGWTDATGRTLLHVAASSNALTTAQYLVDNGLSAQSLDANKKTALFSANSAEMVSLLVRNGAKIDQLDKFGDTAAIQWASRPAMLKVFLDQGANVNFGEGRSYLLLALGEYRRGGAYTSAADLVATIDLLVTRGIDMNRSERSNRVPAIFALVYNPNLLADEDGLTIVKALLAGKPDLAKKNASGRTVSEDLQKKAADLEAAFQQELVVAERIGNAENIERVKKKYGPHIERVQAASELTRAE